MGDNITIFFERMQEYFPLTKEAYTESVEEYGEILETVFIEDIFMPQIIELLTENKDSQLLKKIFAYFEEIVSGEDLHLKDVLKVTVMEVLGNDKDILKIARQYMGKNTIRLQIEADKELGRL